MSKTRVFIACSLDGFIAGPNHELDWLPQGSPDIEDTFSPFFKEVGALLMGRRTYDVVSGFDGPWPYGQKPVLVATTRPLEPKAPSVRAVSGSVEELVDLARETAAPGDVYLDGGGLIRSALDAGLVDEVTLTVVPVVLGEGVPLFAGASQRHQLSLKKSRPIGGGLVELIYEPVPSETAR